MPRVKKIKKPHLGLYRQQLAQHVTAKHERPRKTGRVKSGWRWNDGKRLPYRAIIKMPDGQKAQVVYISDCRARVRYLSNEKESSISPCSYVEVYHTKRRK
jgi:hypothetical protein